MKEPPYRLFPRELFEQPCDLARTAFLWASELVGYAVYDVCCWVFRRRL